MRFNNKILEAVNRGIKLALDDFDFNNNVESKSINDIIDDNEYIEKRIRFNKFAEHYKILSTEQLKELADLHYEFGFTYKVKTKNELKYMIDEYICWIDEKADLNWIDVSDITTFAKLFDKSKFIGNISEWNVSNVKDMQYAFSYSNFNGDISKWDVSNVTNMTGMFMYNDRFNCDISNWDISHVTMMDYMFWRADSFKQDISKWKIHPSLGKLQTKSMFTHCPISRKHKPLKLQ